MIKVARKEKDNDDEYFNTEGGREYLTRNRTEMELKVV
jgi:DNA-binding PadR family transcriptional regulator